MNDITVVEKSDGSKFNSQQEIWEYLFKSSDNIVVRDKSGGRGGLMYFKVKSGLLHRKENNNNWGISSRGLHQYEKFRRHVNIAGTFKDENGNVVELKDGVVVSVSFKS